MCEDKHDGHTKAFFKDQYIYPNYENVEQLPQQIIQQECAKSEQPVLCKDSADASSDTASKQSKTTSGKPQFQPNYEIYSGNSILSKKRVQIKLYKDFKNKKLSF